MAIKRCPYCKAIIEEESGFCSNCGTRLLFPEDEFKEEEIPGDKIIEEEEVPPEQPEEVETDEEHLEKEKRREEEMELKERGQEQAARSEEIEKKDIEKLVEEVKGERAEKEKKESEIKRETQPKSGQMEFKTEELDQIPDLQTKEREDIERFLASLKEGGMKTPSPKAEAPPTPQEKGKEAPESLKEEIPAKIPGEIDTDERLFIRKEIEESLKTGFKAGETEEAAEAEKKEREEIDRFLESVKRERGEKASILEEEEVLQTPKKISEGTSEVKEKLPPWAERVQKGTSLEVEAEQREAAPELGKELQEEAVEEEEKRGEEALDELPSPEKEVELKERTEQVGLPFEQEIEEERIAKRKAPSRLSIWLKRRAFDLLSIAVLWIFTLWLASRLMEVSLFKLISVSALQSLAFYLVLLVIYFSFFILMLGETPGDLIFSREE